MKGTRTEQHLKQAFAQESQSNRRYLHFANKADDDEQHGLAALFRATADAQTQHAYAILHYLGQSGDPLSGKPIGYARDNLRAAVASEEQHTEQYQNMALVARAEGFGDIADWLESLASVSRDFALRYQKALGEIGE